MGLHGHTHSLQDHQVSLTPYAPALAIATHLGEDRPQWKEKGKRLVQVLRHNPEAFAPKERWLWIGITSF